MLNLNKLSTIFRTWGRLYAVTLFFVMLAAGLFWLDSFRAYEAETRILVIGKTPVTNDERVAENFAELVHNLSFYERIISRSDRVEDDFAGLSKDKRKERWNETLFAKQSGDSGILTLTARKETAENAKLWVEETALELFSVAGFYYNIKTDIDMRVVDGPIVKATLKSPIVYGLVSIATAVVFTSLFFWVLSIVPIFLGGKRSSAPTHAPSAPRSAEKAYPSFNIGDSVPLIDPKKFLPSRPTSLSFDVPTAEEKQEEKKIREEILSHGKKASAPANLPVASDATSLPVVSMKELPFEFEETPEPEESAHQPVPELKKSEPTAEEYKRRLNELLSGGK